MKVRNRRITLAVSLVLLAGALAGCGSKDDKKESNEAESMEQYSYLDGYNMVWNDEFEGDSLNRDDWNVELHDPGWVNEEWQAYVDSEENIKVEDGKLSIYPVKKDNGDGTYSYTSGRITTQNKHDYTYGLFEAKLKVPSGKGYLPAFWLMATDENIYGQWPRCGEVDIMEIHGNATKTTYGTAHFGNPHAQSQGEYTLEGIDSFSAGYHTFACEWEPGSLKWYVDGRKIHEEHDWYSTTEGQGTITYPAPFDQPFYMILNLAVGGSWIGYPDETTSFDNNPYQVDYVRVYQRDSYDENVSAKEEEEVVLREPNADGNYINNPNFSEEEDLKMAEDWQFLLANEGKGSATIGNDMLTIETEAEGTVDYSVQLVQAKIPMQKSALYEISFDAYASEPRSFHLAVKAPDRNWIEYFKTTTVDLTTEKQTYTYQFLMTDKTDPNGRLEFNMGCMGSCGTIYLTNVSVKQLSAASPDADKKEILADGNHLYNGKFQEGEKHLGFWNITNNANAEIGVTDFADGRRLKVVASESSKVGDVVIAQDKLAFMSGVDYILTFNAESDVEKDIVIVMGGKEIVQKLSAGRNDYTIKISKSEKFANNNFEIQLGNPGTVFLDEVRLIESAMILNGSFNAGFAGYEWYCDESADATYVVDSLTEDNALDVTVNKTSTEDWKVQIKQNNVKLEQGKKYRLTFKAKCNKKRDIRVLLQGKEDKGWPEYSGAGVITLGADYKTYTIDFEMAEATDPAAFLSICLGKVDKEINEQHRILIDEIKLVEL